MVNITTLKKELLALGTAKKAKASARFFKTGPGQYGEGDVFIGLTVSEQRKIAKQFRDLELSAVEQLPQSPEHEFRLTALLILDLQYQKADLKVQKSIYQLYLRNTKWINNWDLVDGSAPYILGPYLFDKSSAPILKLAKSKSLWERRIAMLATYYHIQQGEFSLAITVAEILLHDEHDLIQKAVGWMLREIGNRSLVTEERFLNQYAAVMPRTMLRYAIEKFAEPKRKKYLAAYRLVVS